MGILGDEYKKAMAESADRPDREDGEFEELPDGYYLAYVEKAVLGSKAGPSGYKQVRVQFRIKKPSKWAKRVQSDFISLAPTAAWRMRSLFEACGFSFDSELEELIEEKVEVILEIEQTIAEFGDKAGEWVAQIVGYHDAEDSSNLAMISKK